MKFDHNEKKQEYNHYIHPIYQREAQKERIEFETYFTIMILYCVIIILYSLTFIFTMSLYEHIIFKTLRLGSLSDSIFINLLIPTCLIGITFYILYYMLYKFFCKEDPTLLNKAILPSLVFVTFVVSPIYFMVSMVMFFLDFYRSPVGSGNLAENYFLCSFLVLAAYVAIKIWMKNMND